MTDRATRTARLLAQGIGPIAVAVVGQSLGNLGFHAVVGRLLDRDSYGALGAVLAAMVMVGVPLGALQAAASTLVAERGPARDTSVRVLRTVAAGAALPAVVILACAPGLRSYFHLGSLLDAAQLAPYLAVAAVLAAARGLLLGERRVGAVAATYLVGTVVRLGAGLALVVPFGVSGALAGTLAGEAAALAFAVHRLARPAVDGAAVASLRLRAVARATVAVTGLFLFSTVDLLLARHYLHGALSGDYVAAATVAKTVLALPAGIMSAVLPRLVAAWPRHGRTRTLLTGGGAVVVPAVLGAALIVAAPGLVLTLLYGDGYGDAAGLVQTLSIVAGLTALVTLMTHAALARRGRTVLLPWAGAAAETVLITGWHGSAAQIAACSAAALVPTMLIMVAAELWAWSRRPQPITHVGPADADSVGTTATAAAPGR
jgi:O-antigen/teichoic acid export membrane protein